RAQFQCATAMKFRLLQRCTGRVELEMTSRTCKRKRCMSERETGISRDCIAQAVDRFIQSRRIAGGAKLVSTHEFRISEVILAVAQALHRLLLQWPVQCTRYLPGNLVFQLGETIHIQIAPTWEARALQIGVVHLQRKTPLSFRFSDGAVDHKADSEA